MLNLLRNGLLLEKSYLLKFWSYMGDAIKITKKFVNYLKEVGIPVEKTLVFGSHAKGTSNLYSDIDVCVVSSVFGKDNYDETVDLRKKALKIDDRLEPVALIRKYGVSVPLE